MKLTTRIARRFLLGGKGAGPSRFTGWVAIVGLAVGSLALVVSVSVLNGFESLVRDRIRGFEGDLRITGLAGSSLKDRLAKLTRQEEIQVLAPYLERKAVLFGPDQSRRMVTVKAVDTERPDRVYRLGAVDRDTSVTAGVWIGSILADRLGVQPGDRIRLYSPVDGLTQFGQPAYLRLPVQAVFTSDVLNYDDIMAFIPWRYGERLFSRKRQVDGADIRLRPGVSLSTFKSRMVTVLGDAYKVETWEELHENLFHAMRMERIGAVVILTLIIVVAAFNLATTLVLVTFQKIREIGILRVIGMTALDLRSVIRKQGFFIGGSGLAAGIVLGLGVVAGQQTFGWIRLPTDIYAFSHLPMIITLRDVIVIPAIGILCIFSATQVAIHRALKIHARDAIQTEK